MCLFEKEENIPFSQGGTYDQYRRLIGNHPDHGFVRSLDPFLVWGSHAARRVPSQARYLDQDQ